MSPFHGQPWLDPVQGLKLALFVDAEHQCMLRRCYILLHQILQLLYEAVVPDELERPNPVGSQPVGPPDSLRLAITEAHYIGQAPNVPVSRLRALPCNAQWTVSRTGFYPSRHSRLGPVRSRGKPDALVLSHRFRQRVMVRVVSPIGP